MKNTEVDMTKKLLDENPKLSRSWNEPCFTAIQEDGSKIEWYERDLDPDTKGVMEKLLINLQQRNELEGKYQQALIITQSMQQIMDLHELFYEKLLNLNPGKKIVEGGTVTLETNIKTKGD